MSGGCGAEGGCACGGSVPTRGGGDGCGGGGGGGGGCCSSSSSSARPSTALAGLPGGGSSGMRIKEAVRVPPLPSPPLSSHSRPSGPSSADGGRRGRHSSRHIAPRSRHPSSGPSHRRPLSLSSKLLILILVVYVASISVVLFVPESQGLVIFCHWVKIPLFKSLDDLVSFRIPHGRNIEITTEDGMVLKGWHLLPAHQMAAEAAKLHTSGDSWDNFFDEAMTREGSRVVIYFHGNAATRGQWNRVELIKSISAVLASHVIAVDYRGFGDSTGWPTEEGLAQDALAVWKWVQEKTKGSSSTDNRGTSKVYLYGHSLGSGVVVKLANHLETEATLGAPTGLILDAPFTNLSSAALHHPSALPFRLFPFIKQALLASMGDPFPSIRLISNVTAPVLVLHGRNDHMIPFHLGYELYQTAKLARLRKSPHLLEDLWFSEYPQAGHNDIYAYPQWIKDMSAFMKTMERSSPQVLAAQCLEEKSP